MTVPAPTGSAPVATTRSSVTRVLLQVVGAVLALVGGFGTALLTVLLVPLRVGHAQSGPLASLEPARSIVTHPELGTWRVPVAVAVAVGGAWFFVWFTRSVTGWRGSPALPAVGWFTMVVAALSPSDAGDRLLVPDDWVATLALFGGTVVFVVGFVTSFVPAQARGTIGRRTG